MDGLILEKYSSLRHAVLTIAHRGYVGSLRAQGFTLAESRPGVVAVFPIGET